VPVDCKQGDKNKRDAPLHCKSLQYAELAQPQPRVARRMVGKQQRDTDSTPCTKDTGTKFCVLSFVSVCQANASPPSAPTMGLLALQGPASIMVKVVSKLQLRLLGRLLRSLCPTSPWG
jgi:hypothetical protein